MKYIQVIHFGCDGCGAIAQGARETAVINGQEFSRAHHPKGWTASVVRPALHIVSQGPPEFDPFAPAMEIAGKLGAPVEVIRCPKCVAAVAKGVSRIVMPTASTAEPETPPTGAA